MWQELFRIPIPGGHEVPVYGYGLMLVLGVILAMSSCETRSPRSGSGRFASSTLTHLHGGASPKLSSRFRPTNSQFPRRLVQACLSGPSSSMT